MPGQLMSGLWRYMLKVPPYLWEKQIQKTRAKAAASLGFMSAEHRRVHHFVVRELPRLGLPMPPKLVSDALDMDMADVISILDDLQEHMTFLFRNEVGEVTWAYPVTVEQTPHHMAFSSGEQLYAA